MSYARFGWDNSDVYVFDIVDGGTECCGCGISEDRTFVSRTHQEMIEHLEAHRTAGDHVPQETIDELAATPDNDDEPSPV